LASSAAVDAGASVDRSGEDRFCGVTDGAEVTDSESSSLPFDSLTAFCEGGLPRRFGADDESADAEDLAGAESDTTSMLCSANAAKKNNLVNP
jgi:hypothetical protein